MIKNKYFLGVDIGYSFLKIVAGEYGTRCKEYYLPATASPLSLLSDSIVCGAKEIIFVIIDNEQWVAGFDHVVFSGGVRQLHNEYLSSQQYKALFYAALAKSEREVIDTLVTGIPVNQYKDVEFRKDIKNRLMGCHQIAPKRSVTVNKVIILPQPVGTYMEMVDLSNDDCDLLDMLSGGLTIVIDHGYFSVDWFVFERGKAMIDHSGTSLEAMSNIIKETKELIKTNFAYNANLDKLEMNIRDGTLKMTIGDSVKSFKKYYNIAREDVIKKAITQIKNENRNTDATFQPNLVIITGGGSYAYKGVIEAVFKKYQVAVLVPENPEFSNARGFWKIAATANYD